ncbi:unnamed protein product [Timema podura]|uniref:Uncharacterized protein n=1 Tax=Timema podura TaxID=61482 RepID=A0ABN7P443_TIMPD|nr:unnamed protein product [Timema podura]
MAEFIGTWEIVSCIPLAETGAPGKSGIEGTRFSLDNMGDVTWTLSEGAKQFPLFQCETYEVYKSSLSGVVLRFGAGCTGHIIEFRAEHPENQDTMLLSCESWCLLQCRRVFSGEFNSPVLSTFSLLPALEEGYFSDLTITAANNKQEVVLRVLHYSLSSGRMESRSREWVVTNNFLQEAAITSLSSGSNAEC